MRNTTSWISKLCALGLLFALSALGLAGVLDQGTIVIDRAVNSPTLTVRYSGVKAATVELRVNGTSYSTRSVNVNDLQGETNFTLDLKSLKFGDNDVEIRLYDKDGRFLGSERSTITTEEGQTPVYLIGPKVGATVMGPVQVSVGFGKELKNTYVSFFIDNHFKSMSNTPPFNYIWDTARDSNGWHEVEAWVVDDSSNTYKTRKLRIFVNNPGGHTFRPMPKAEAPPAAKPEAASVKVAAPPIKAQPAPSPTQTPKVALVESGNNAVIPTGAAANTVKTASTTAIGAAERAGSALVPTASVLVPAKNTITVATSGNAGLKSGVLGTARATDQQLMMPTGTRTVGAAITTLAITQPKVSPMTSGQAAIKTTSTATGTKPTLEGPIGGSYAPKVHFAPLPKVTAATVVSKPAKPVEIKTTAKLQAHAPVHASSVVSAATVIPVTHGKKVPYVGAITIVLDAKPLSFDVQPRVQDGVPLTPFRHLFEQSGGKVDWGDKTKTVQANKPGYEVYIKIGDKVAKVNNLPVDLDLAPFIEKGRTIVPVSFIREALGVNVDFDEKTGQVLITKIAKK